MVERNTMIRAANELSLAVWFGGSLMGATAIERGADAADGAEHRVESAAWNAWQPIQIAAIATQLASGAALTIANRRRIVGQRGIATTSAVRTALTGAAIALTVVAARSGQKVAARSDGQHSGEGDGRTDTRRLRITQWMVPAVTGAMLVVDALMGEQQRPNQVLHGTFRRVLPARLRAA
jgi:hypothetical protein